MRLIVRLDPKLLRQWHLRAVQRLARRPHTELGVEWTHACETLPFAAVALAAAERRVHRLPRGDALAAATAAEFAPFMAGEGFRTDLGFVPAVNLEEGLTAEYQWVTGILK